MAVAVVVAVAVAVVAVAGERMEAVEVAAENGRRSRRNEASASVFLQDGCRIHLQRSRDKYTK